MAEPKHTLGPWSCDEWTIVSVPAATAVASVLQAEDFPCLAEEHFDDHQAECEANLRLIASAPDLLAACLAAVDAIDCCAPEVVDQLVAAIAKATGEGS